MVADREADSRALLARLLTRVGLTHGTAPSDLEWTAFVELVVSLLSDLEQDRYLLERSLEVSSDEMRALYEDLRAGVDALAAEQAELRASAATLAATLESTVDGILVVDLTGRITTHNRRFAKMWGIPESILNSGDRAAALSFVCEQLAHPEEFIAIVRELYATQDAASHDTIEFTDGRIFERDSLPQILEGQIVGRVYSFRDVTERLQMQQQLTHLAFHDSLTNLANRAVLDDHIHQALQRQGRIGGLVAVAVVDLDGFKLVNDTMGHHVGDVVLVALAERLRSTLREVDTLARLGGDEFAILVDGLETPEQAGQIGTRILEALTSPVDCGDREMVLGASVGIALARGEATHSDELIRHADLAMYHAKRDGKNTYRIFETPMHDIAVRHHRLEQALRKATADGTLSIAYQPIVDARTGFVRSFEALTRWQHPLYGSVGPDTFIPMAEDIGLIREIGRLILGGACRQVQIWHERFPALRPNIAVNVSGRQLTDPAFVNIVEATLAHAHLDPASLVLEVTESVMTSESARARTALAELRARGVRIAIDDFGTGYSSLSGLSDLPVDTLKIDKRFVSGLFDDRRGVGIMQAILLLARTHDLHTVGEGIERIKEQWLLVELGCDSLQGYLFGRPMSAPDATAYLEGCAETLTRSAPAGEHPGDRIALGTEE